MTIDLKGNCYERFLRGKLWVNTVTVQVLTNDQVGSVAAERKEVGLPVSARSRDNQMFNRQLRRRRRSQCRNVILPS
jgi:hypothetical protein